METVLAGRLTIIADELLLDVNSVERFLRGKKWLEKIKGVKFEKVHTRHPTKDDVPPDEKFASQAEPDVSEMPEEVKQLLKTQMQDYCECSAKYTPLGWNSKRRLLSVNCNGIATGQVD